MERVMCPEDTRCRASEMATDADDDQRADREEGSSNLVRRRGVVRRELAEPRNNIAATGEAGNVSGGGHGHRHCPLFAAPESAPAPPHRVSFRRGGIMRVLLWVVGFIASAFFVAAEDPGGRPSRSRTTTARHSSGRPTVDAEVARPYFAVTRYDLETAEKLVRDLVHGLGRLVSCGR